MHEGHQLINQAESLIVPSKNGEVRTQFHTAVAEEVRVSGCGQVVDVKPRAI